MPLIQLYIFSHEHKCTVHRLFVYKGFTCVYIWNYQRSLNSIYSGNTTTQLQTQRKSLIPLISQTMQFSTQLSDLSRRFNSQITRTDKAVHHSNAVLTPETLPGTPGLDTCVQASEQTIMLSAKVTVAYVLYTKLPNEFPHFCPVAAHLPFQKRNGSLVIKRFLVSSGLGNH